MAKLKLIENKLKIKMPGTDQNLTQKDYRTLVKHLIFTVFANPGPVLSWNTACKIFETMNLGKKQPGQGDYRSILFWTPSQFQIMQLDQQNLPCMRNVLFISSMSTGKTECMKGMVENLLKEGQRCHFIFFNQRCPKKTLLHLQLENHFQGNKNRDKLEFSYLSSDATYHDTFFSDLKKVVWKHPGYNTFIDELTLPMMGIKIAPEIRKIVLEMRMPHITPCLWITIAGIYYGTGEDFSLEKLQAAFPDFFIPILRFPMRNCKQIISYVLGNNKQLEFDHDGDSGTSFLDIDIPDNLMEGLEPTDVGVGYARVIEKAMRLVGERQGN